MLLKSIVHMVRPSSVGATPKLGPLLLSVMVESETIGTLGRLSLCRVPWTSVTQPAVW